MHTLQVLNNELMILDMIEIGEEFVIQSNVGGRSHCFITPVVRTCFYVLLIDVKPSIAAPCFQ